MYIYNSKGVITYKITWYYSEHTANWGGTFGERKKNWGGERNGKVDIFHFTLCDFGDATDSK